MREIFEPVQVQLEALGFQSVAGLFYARPIREGCWCFFQLRGTEEFAFPITAFTLPYIGAVVQKYLPMFRAERGVKGYDGRFTPPLLHDEKALLLAEANPIWGPVAAQQRGSPMGRAELDALIRSMDLYATQRQQEGWSQDMVMERLLALPSDDHRSIAKRWAAPVWFAQREAWDEFEDFANAMRDEQGFEYWSKFADKVRSHFGREIR